MFPIRHLTASAVLCFACSSAPPNNGTVTSAVAHESPKASVTNQTAKSDSAAPNGETVRPRSPFEAFGEMSPVVGELAPDFTLSDTNGKTFQLSEAVKDRPLVMVFGSFS